MDHQTAVAENRAALQATIEFGLRKLGVVKWEPAPASEAAGELALADIRADGSPWGEDQPRTAYAAANLRWDRNTAERGRERILRERTCWSGPISL